MSDQDKQLTILLKQSDFYGGSVGHVLNTSLLKMYIDGAARNNPGPAGAGVCLMRGEETIFEQGFYLGIRTNNQAEYFALLIGSYFVKEYINIQEQLIIYSDSLLLVRQMTGLYKVRNPLLQELQKNAYQMLQAFNVKFGHVYRENNTRADLLANRGVDKLIPLPKKFVDFMHIHNIK